jgi:hypothetical protein
MIAISLIILAASVKAMADTIDHHFDTSVFRNLNPRFWDLDISSDHAKRIFKYKLDAWHLSQSAMIVLMISAVAVHPFDRWHLHWALEILIAGITWNIVFNTFYNKILRRKPRPQARYQERPMFMSMEMAERYNEYFREYTKSRRK